MGFYLLDNPNPNGDKFYRSRQNGPVLQIVLHATASVEDQDMRGADASAEQTARYASNTTRDVSWHSGSDSDTWLRLLPAHFTAWHVRGYNSRTYGHEISKSDMSWSDEPEDWVAATLAQAADALRPIAAAFDIPYRLLTKSQVDRGMKGFVYHETLDPTRRSDPGDDFPINRFFSLMEAEDMPLNDKDLDRIANAVWARQSNVWPDLIEQDRLPARRQLNQARGFAQLSFNRGKRISRALARFAETLPAEVRDAIQADLADAVDEEAIAENVLAGLAEAGFTPEEVAQEFANAFPPEFAQQVVDALAAQLQRGDQA